MSEERHDSNRIRYSRQTFNAKHKSDKPWAPRRPSWQGFIVTRQPLEGPPSYASYWYKIEQYKSLRYELAGVDQPVDWFTWLTTNFGAHADWLSYLNAELGHYYFGRLLGSQLNVCVFISTDGNLPSRSRIASFFQDAKLSQEDCRRLLAGTLQRRRTEDAEILCYCFCVKQKVIVNAILQQGLHTIEQLRDRLMAGSRCQGCLTAIKAVLEKTLDN